MLIFEVHHIYLSITAPQEVNELNNDDMDIDKIDLVLKFLLKIGCFTTIVSLLGLFMQNVKNESASVALNALYTSALFSGGLFAAIIIGALVAQRADFTSDQLSSMAKRNWRLMYAFKRDQIEQFQREKGCCGWHNVFDYCSPHAMFAIQYESIKHKQLSDLLSSIDESSSLDDSSSSSAWFENGSQAYFLRLTDDNVEDLLGTGFLIPKQSPGVNVMTIDDFYYEYDDSYDSNNFDCEDNLATCACSQLFTYNDVFYNFMDCYIDRENKTVKGLVFKNSCKSFTCD